MWRLYLPSPPPEEGGAVGKRGGGVGHFKLVHLDSSVLCDVRPPPPHCSLGGWQEAWLKGGSINPLQPAHQTAPKKGSCRVSAKIHKTLHPPVLGQGDDHIVFLARLPLEDSAPWPGTFGFITSSAWVWRNSSTSHSTSPGVFWSAS